MDVKVGHAYEPYDALHEVTWSSSSEDWDQHVSAFMTRGDDATGLAFFVHLTGGSLCLDDVLQARFGTSPGPGGVAGALRLIER